MGESHLKIQLRRRMKLLNHTPKSLSKAAGLNDTAVRDILEGSKSKNPRTDTIRKLAKSLGCTSADLTGDSHVSSEDVAADTGPSELDEAIAGAQTRIEKWHDSLTLVRELDAQAAAGPNAGLKEISVDNIEEMTRAVHGFPKDGFQQLYGGPADQVGIIDVVGDSNVPDLFPGQKVMVHFGDKTPSPPGFFVLWDGLGVVIKQIEHIDGSDPPRLKISSRNPSYQPYERVMGEAHILGRVLGHWRRL